MKLLHIAGLLALGVFVVALAACASGGGDDGTEPAAAAVLRIEPAEQTVACGREPVAIRVFLDDLAARPSPNQPEVSYGMAGFQFLLRYDPDIVRIADPAVDVELNPSLDEEDPDGDGVRRDFFLLSNVDDLAGEALLGGVSLVPGGSGADNLEEGPAPGADGEPLLLLTVRFLTVGQGSTALTLRDPAGQRHPSLEEPAVADANAKAYEPLTVHNATLTVQGGDCPPAPVPTP